MSLHTNAWDEARGEVQLSLPSWGSTWFYCFWPRLLWIGWHLLVTSAGHSAASTVDYVGSIESDRPDVILTANVRLSGAYGQCRADPGYALARMGGAIDGGQCLATTPDARL